MQYHDVDRDFTVVEKKNIEFSLCKGNFFAHTPVRELYNASGTRPFPRCCVAGGARSSVAVGGGCVTTHWPHHLCGFGEWGWW